MTRSADILIVGAGHAGAQAAIGLRQGGYRGSIAIISEEADLPYERPPLSKEYLAGEKLFNRILLKPEGFWNERGIELLTSRRVVAVDPAKSEVEDQNGERIGYGKLVWAAGGHARRLSCGGAELTGVHSIRTRADVDRLAYELRMSTSVTIIGAGYIGLEAAAVLTKLGKKVVVLEAQDRALARVAGEPISDFYAQEHISRGVDLRFGVAVDCLLGEAARVKAVSLTNGQSLHSDIVIVGIGIVPAVEALVAAGSIGNNGVDVDEFCRTNLPDIYAIGDCAAHLNSYAGGRRIRLESVQNANDQAMTVISDILGKPKSYRAIPWFWSNQYDLRLQTVGLSIGYDQTVIRGNPMTRSFSLVYLRAGRVIALDCVNAVKDYVQGKVLVQAGSRPAAAELGNIERPLKDLV